MSAKEKEVEKEVKKEEQVGVGLSEGDREDGQSVPPAGSETPKKPAAIDPAEANIILDAIFTRGVYEEEVDLPRGHKCVFATRSTKQAKEILARLEGDNPTKMPRYNQLYGLYCLTASLRSMDGRLMPELFDEKIKIIDLWAGPLADILIDELVKFDDKVAAAYTTEQAKN